MEEPLQNSAKRPRLHSLDSLRGLACLIVLFGHTIGAFAWDRSIYNYFLINNLVDGRSAVTFFFVLSGFVLTFPSFGKNKKPLILVPFFVRRFTRIWIPWFIFFLLSWIAREFLWGDPPQRVVLSQHQLIFWQEEGNIVDFLKQCLFLLNDNSKALIPQDWSLRVEMRAAVIIPVVIILARKEWFYLVIFSAGLLLLVPRTGHYYISFLVGSFMANLYTRKNFNGVWPTLAILGGFCLYQTQWAGAQLLVKAPIFVSKDIVWTLSSIGCGLIMLGVLSQHCVKRFMEAGFLLYLGRISYSLYLVHMIVILCVAPWILDWVVKMGVESVPIQQACVVVGVGVLSIVAADLGERLVERPCIVLGRLSTKWMKQNLILNKLKV